MTIEWTIPCRKPDLSYLPGYHDGWLMAWGVSHEKLDTPNKGPSRIVIFVMIFWKKKP